MNLHQIETTRKRCRACGEAYDYPLKGDAATSRHCAVCATLPASHRRIFERLQRRLSRLEKQLRSSR